MSAPNLTMSPQPAEGSSVVYGLLAAKTANESPNGQLSLVLRIKNEGASTVHLYQVSVSFMGPPAVGSSDIAADVTIDPQQTKTWICPTANNILLPVPAPAGVRFELYCDDQNYDDPAVFDLPLAQYQSPADDGGYEFPARSGDLGEGEYWAGVSAAHGPAGGGTQLFAYDLVVRAHNPQNNNWPTRKPGSDNTLNESYYAWGKPLYAMADGVVVQFLDGMQANTPPGFPSPTPNTVEGNHFYIQHGDDLALYAHLIAGTLNPDLTSGPNADGTGAAVARGQLIGLAGNSGRSSEPHLHLQVNRTATPWGGPPRPLPFNDVHVLDLAVVEPGAWPPDTDSPWNETQAAALPSVYSAVWPGKLRVSSSGLIGALGPLAWAWIIFVGGLMITPGGVSCPGCGRGLTIAMGILSVVLGALGFVSRAMTNRAAARKRLASPQVNVSANFDTPHTDIKGDVQQR